ncbi:MAG: signal peptide peptidase SppA, partial [Alphaproteobacteria bacterium]
RRRLKRRLTFWRILAIVIAVALVAVAAGRLTGYRSGDYVARFTISNVIVDDDRRHDALERIARDSNAKALIVRVDSPGGTVVGGEALYQSLLKVAKTKPLVAVMGQVATSAAYMAALAADHIIAREGTITGSIGVLLQTTEITGLLGKLGITTEAIKSGPLKAVPSPFEPMTPDVRKSTQALVDDIFAMFLRLVAERRKLTLRDARALSDGRVFTGRTALENRLIDAIGGEAEAITWLETKKKIATGLPVRPVKARREVGDWFDYLESLARKTTFSERLTLDGLISVWHPEVR